MAAGVSGLKLILPVVLLLVTMISGCASKPPRQAASPPTSAAPARPAPTSTVTSTPTPAPAPPAVPALGRAGTYQVRARQLTFTEPGHPGPAGGLLGPRTLVTHIWYPHAGQYGGAFPLLVFAPGFLQCSAAYSDLLQTWAGAGFVVAAVDFPRTNCRLGVEADEADVVNQPADMSYVVTRLLALSAQPGDLFSGMLDPDDVGAAGQSDGGDTVAALAASTCCIDHRVKGVAVLSGAEWPVTPGRYFPGGSPPMLFTQGSADTVNPPWLSLQLYRADGNPRYYLDLLGASHLTPYQGTNPVEQLVARVTLAFFDRYLLGQADALEAMNREGNSRGMATLVKDGHLPGLSAGRATSCPLHSGQPFSGR